jgi:hypothetical protein
MSSGKEVLAQARAKLALGLAPEGGIRFARQDIRQHQNLRRLPITWDMTGKRRNAIVA